MADPAYIVGMDPGKSGAIAFLNIESFELMLYDMPTHQIKPGQKSRIVIDHVAAADILRDVNIPMAYIEEVNAMPGQGVVSMFSFGRSFGTLFGICGGLQIPLTQVRPAVWKKTLKVPADKDAARYRASQLMPSCSRAWNKSSLDGRAEAALIALYGFSDMGFSITKAITLGN